MGFNQKQIKEFLGRYKGSEHLYNKFQSFLFSKDKIPYAKKLDTEVNKQIKDIKLYYCKYAYTWPPRRITLGQLRKLNSTSPIL